MGHFTRDDGVVVAARALHQAFAAGGQVMEDRDGVKVQCLPIDHVQVGFKANRNPASVAEAGGVPLLVELLRDGSAEAKKEAAGALMRLVLTMMPATMLAGRAPRALVILVVRVSMVVLLAWLFLTSLLSPRHADQ